MRRGQVVRQPLTVQGTAESRCDGVKARSVRLTTQPRHQSNAHLVDMSERARWRVLHWFSGNGDLRKLHRVRSTFVLAFLQTAGCMLQIIEVHGYRRYWTGYASRSACGLAAVGALLARRARVGGYIHRQQDSRGRTPCWQQGSMAHSGS